MSIDAVQSQSPPPPRTCLFCDQPAASLEHIIPQSLGGRLARRIVCLRHNGCLNVACDEPLVNQFQYFVHALRVVTERRDPGIAVIGATASGKTFVVDSDHKPRLPRTQVLERDAKGLPTKVIAPDEESARKLIASMGLDPDTVPLEVRTERPEALNFPIKLGGAEGFRGVLKIAYEYVRAYLGATVSDSNGETSIHNALLHGGDPAAFVRWLPYELADSVPRAEFFSHRVLAAPADGETLVVIEFFNVAPFIVRLPGILVDGAHMLFQGLSGELPVEPRIDGRLPFGWASVQEHAQPQMFPGFQERIGTIISAMQTSDALCTTVEAFAVAAGRDPSSSDDDILDATLNEIERVFSTPLQDNQRQTLREFASALLPLLRSGAFSPRKA